ncbi:MAG: DNA gyrase inhibitor YacG [Albidovulum sp.]|nr:DNA gyrase inhibitor YacG [Albidovulum sp.]MDE0305645.1 DNA gyrase inhibitor YacG [Albidovulum sp.]
MAGMNCPICGKKMVEQFTPFCSKRCSYVDLNRWLKGEYRIPGPPLDRDEESMNNGESQLGN